jgi:hypothetical protein
LRMERGYVPLNFQTMNKIERPGELEIDLSPVELTVEYVLGEIQKRAPEWSEAATKIGWSKDSNKTLFLLLTLMRSLGFVAQDLLTSKGETHGAASVGAMLTLMQTAFEKQLEPVEIED